jgi:3-hydroxy-9,10-secoandrosta-1,3,5(10)-triene-9,17-dione monooxygenase
MANNALERDIVIPTEAEMIERVRAMLPYFRSMDAECEALGRCPDEVEAKLREGRFFEMLKPKAYGGYEMSLTTAMEVVRLLASASPAIAWVAALLIIHNWEIALVDPRVAEEIWGNDPDATISSSYAPFGKAEKVEGGYRVNGSWAWSSGCDACTWAVVGVMFPADNQFGVVQKVMIIPRSDYTIDQNSWDMAGMQGSGSKTVIVKDAFVPEWRVHDVMESFEGRNPGSETFTAPIYKVPFGAIFAWSLATLCIGMAEGAIELYADHMRKRHHAYNGKAMALNPYTQLKLGEAAAMVSAARGSQMKDFGEMLEYVSRSEPIPHSARIAYKSNAAFAARLATDALTKVIKAAGGSAFNRSNQLQRLFRDIHTGSNHAFINPDRGAANHGRFLLTGQIADFVI